MLLLYTALRLHQGVHVGGTILGLLGWGFWLHLCHALVSVGTHKHLANSRRMARRSAQRSSRRGHAACRYNPCTRHACLYECFVRMLAHHRELQHSRLHRWSPQIHASLLEVRTSTELRMLVAEYLADQGAAPSLVAGTRGCEPGGTAAVWALTNMSGLPVRIVTGMGNELLRTAPMQVWSLCLHHQHYAILEPLERSSLHTWAIKVALLEQPLPSVHTCRRGLCSRVLAFVQLLAGKAQALACTAPSTRNIADWFFAFSLFVVLNSTLKWDQLWQKATAQVRACCGSVSAVLGGASLLASDPLRGAGKQAKGIYRGRPLVPQWG
eukprot:4831582-Amphidinium_carterae.1